MLIYGHGTKHLDMEGKMLLRWHAARGDSRCLDVVGAVSRLGVAKDCELRFVRIDIGVQASVADN